MRSFAARLPNLLLFLAFVAYPARSTPDGPLFGPLLACGATPALRGGARRPTNGRRPPCIPLPWPFTDSGPDLAAVSDRISAFSI